jgi:uncharacterized membrane protein
MLCARYFANPLIVDRECSGSEAIQGSWRLTRGHFWGLFGVSLLMFLLMLAGLLACLIGALFMAPLVSLVTTAGYVLIAGSRPIRRLASVGTDRHYVDE